MNTAFVPIVIDGVKLVPKVRPDLSCDGCSLSDNRLACFKYPCTEGSEYIIYVEESNVSQMQPQ